MVTDGRSRLFCAGWYQLGETTYLWGEGWFQEGFWSLQGPIGSVDGAACSHDISQGHTVKGEPAGTLKCACTTRRGTKPPSEPWYQALPVPLVVFLS
jgi:hypothetical protein